MGRTAMSFTERATAMSKQMNWRWVAVLLAAGTLGGCYNQLRISPDYGVATRQNIAASIADPDAHYTGDPQPGSNSERVSLAERRYVTGRVIPPALAEVWMVAAVATRAALRRGRDCAGSSLLCVVCNDTLKSRCDRFSALAAKFGYILRKQRQKCR